MPYGIHNASEFFQATMERIVCDEIGRTCTIYRRFNDLYQIFTEFEFDLEHLPGEQQVFADALSRIQVNSIAVINFSDALSWSPEQLIKEQKKTET